MILRRSFTLLLAAVLLSATWASAFAQTLDFKYFDETGHNVQGEFLKFYNANPNALILFGYPITEEFTKDGLNVQYFQRARFELHAELPEGQRVTLTPLGTVTYSTSEPMNVSGNALTCQKFSTGFEVCYDFLEFFNKYGGANQFGNPISTFEYRDNKIVQYFERARFEWQPGRPEAQRVVLSDLGRIYFDRLREEPALLSSVKPMDNSQSSILRLKSYAFVKKAVTLADDSQSIFIVVQDQNLRPVSNASCNATITWPDKHSDLINIATNENGIGIIPLTFTQQQQGNLVYANVSCTYKDLKTSTVTSFRIWY
ncbi:MAG: hypothetical protein JNM55_00315 [Anaerolineales bacterium]|nr:hypothetical protein [Anaerolineales bacterium]